MEFMANTKRLKVKLFVVAVIWILHISTPTESLPLRKVPVEVSVVFSPDLDFNGDIERLKTSEAYLHQFLQCITTERDDFCDDLGIFFKVRMEHALILDECENCTLKQAADISEMVSFLQNEKALVYRAIMVRLLSSLGIQVSRQEQLSANSLLN